MLLGPYYDNGARVSKYEHKSYSSKLFGVFLQSLLACLVTCVASYGPDHLLSSLIYNTPYRQKHKGLKLELFLGPLPTIFNFMDNDSR